MKIRMSPSALVLAAIALTTPAQAVHAATAPPVQAPTPAKLAVGDPAPALKLDSFVKGEPIAELAKGKTYLLQFWAPWNNASVHQFQMLSDLQKRLGEKGLVVVAIASTDINGTTAERVREKVTELGDAVKIAVAWDSGSTTKDAYLKASGKSLPCAVFVDGEGRVALIGSADLVARFADSIVAGTHDLAALAAWQVKAARTEQTARSLVSAYQAGKWSELVGFADELLEVDPIGFGGNAQWRMLAQAKLGQADKAKAWATTWIADAGKNSPQGLNAVAWALVDPENAFPGTDLELAMRAAQRAVELTHEEDGAILDTLARVYFVKGDVAKALELQKLALANLKPDQKQFREQIAATLKTYEAALK